MRFLAFWTCNSWVFEIFKAILTVSNEVKAADVSGLVKFLASDAEWMELADTICIWEFKTGHTSEFVFGNRLGYSFEVKFAVFTMP